ncbi:hypothetical protein EJ07DRAFT_152616 [Lizonia empirigonia]|nr:hypothetical protein EJ07DRAFT_152616 [Lizonia empirigonia]
MSVAIQPPVSLPPSSVPDTVTGNQDKKGKSPLRTEDNHSPKEKARTTKRVEGQGVEEFESDAPPEKDEESDTSHNSESSSSDPENDADDEEKKAARKARKAARPKDYYDKRDAADRRQVAATANEGFSNYVKQRAERAAPEKRPDLVEKEWRGLYSLLKNQWKKGGEPELQKNKVEIFKRANKKIERYCDGIMNVDIVFNTKANALYLAQLKELEKDLVGKPESSKVLRRKQLLTECAKAAGQPSREELLKKWKFPTDELCGQIYAIEKALEELDKLPSEAAYKDKITSYERRLAKSQEGAKASSLAKKKTTTEKMLAERKSKTKKMLQTALIFLDNLEQRAIPPDRVLSSRAVELFQGFVSLSRENTELYNALKAELERPTLEQLDGWETATRPMCDFITCVNDEVMVTEQTVTRAQDLITNLGEIDREVVARGKTGETHCLPMSLLHEIFNHFKEGQLEQVQLNVATLLDHLRRHEASAGLARAIEVGEPLNNAEADTDSAQPTIKSESAPNATVEATSKASITNASAEASLNTSSDLSEDFLRKLDITSLKLGSNITKVFQYDNGMTEHGPLAATRLSTSDNTAHNRYCVNSGLAETGWEYFKVFKGGDLGPGGAERLADQKVVDFDLKQRLKDIKGDHPITKIGPVVVMSRSEGYVRRGTKERRPDAYIFVHYRAKPEPDLLCRTQFSQLAKKFGEKNFAALEKVYQNTRVYFEACKVQRLHPKTQKPLTAADLQKTPWFFPETDRSVPGEDADIKSEQTDEADDDDPLKGVTVDTGALAGITDSFKKPRVDLANLSQGSSSSNKL